jgi:[acyl-carrier-protein] S-malonyltransferase
MPQTKFGFVFPGQGSQSVGMLADLAKTYSLVTETYAEASEVLGYDLWKLTLEGPEQTLNQTTHTQPALLAAGVAVWRVWQSRTSAAPALLAGHSLGEYAALVCADALEFTDALALVAARGRYMQEAVPEGQGAMAAILGLDDGRVIAACVAAQSEMAGEIVAAVNFNSPGQVVIAGHSKAVERAMDLAKQSGAKRALRLPVSVPSHCALMRPAALRLAQDLAKTRIQPPRIPVINNVDAAAAQDPAQIRDSLTRQLFQPVRWVEIVRSMAAEDIHALLECGPGSVLTGLNKRIVPGLNCMAMSDPAGLELALTAIETT